ncbi:MAG TPA: zinc-ribbon domain-containing protein [Polyangiaceae bacterium]|nr:zinc-ribbon domain-containing protein [Polyangiaceae bacterium]
MKVSCPACDSKYTIADEKVAGRKVKVRCKSCGGQILINGTIPPPAPGPDEAPAAAADNEATRIYKGVEADAEGGESLTHDSPQSSPKGSSPRTAEVAKSSPQSAQDYTPPPASAEDDGIVWSVNVSETDERSLKTHEVVAGYLSGEFAGEVYVWRDGMGDWTSITDAPELAAAIEAAKKKSPAGAAKHKALPTAGKGKTVETPAVETAAGQAAKKQAARITGAKRPQSAHDLFAAASTAGSETDVTVSESDDSPQKMTGARNENSVLFSLDALKAGITATPQKTSSGKKPPATPRKKLEDLMSSGSGVAGPSAASALVLNASQALLTAPAPPPPPPKPDPIVVAASVPPAAAVPASPKKKLGMVVGIVAAIMATGVIAGVTVSMLGKDPPAPVVSAVQAPLASAPATTPAAAATPAVAAAETPKPAEPAADAKPAEPTGDTKTATGAGAKTGAGVAAPAKPGAVAAAPGGAKPAETPKKETPKKEEAAAAPPSGGAAFSREAAAQALSVAASQTSICKKPDGPTGTGKVQVTFAPSGRATTANIISGPFGGTAVGGCVSGVFKRAKVPAFSGDPVTVAKSFTISP